MVTGRVKRELSWTDVDRERAKTDEHVCFRFLGCGKKLGFDKDNPGRLGAGTVTGKWRVYFM